jgi:hypothetical protein
VSSTEQELEAALSKITQSLSNNGLQGLSQVPKSSDIKTLKSLLQQSHDNKINLAQSEHTRKVELEQLEDERIQKSRMFYVYIVLLFFLPIVVVAVVYLILQLEKEDRTKAIFVLVGGLTTLIIELIKMVVQFVSGSGKK